jgi:hypothetical protein
MEMRSSLITKTTIEEGIYMSKMYNPPHPGEILADTVLREHGGISVTEFAEKLGMTRTDDTELKQFEYLTCEPGFCGVPRDHSYLDNCRTDTEGLPQLDRMGSFGASGTMSPD